MECRRFSVVIWFSFVGCVLLWLPIVVVSDSNISFLISINLLASLSVKAAKVLRKEEKREMKIPSNSKLYFWI